MNSLLLLTPEERKPHWEWVDDGDGYNEREEWNIATLLQAQLDKLAGLTPEEVREEIFTFLETIHCFQDDDGIPWGIPDETIEYIINHVCILITTQVEQAVKAERERIRKNR